ncbi:MAG: hypothetical protein HY841_07785 [Bacteroidetes bacterium]|nr:hypothetical protein [Bacteroidota bacterium]
MNSKITVNMKHKGNLLIIPALIAAITASLVTLSAVEGSARENVNSGKVIKPAPAIFLSAPCAAATAQTDLDVNNVRARILNGGDMWWDLANGQYEIPKNGGVMSIFAGALWIGGIDAGNNLKVAAQNYRQNGNDFWPGPLDTSNASINDLVCAQYDKHYKITRKEVEDFANGIAPATPVILNWPGNGNTSIGQAKYLAPFYDGNMDGVYDPTLTFVDALDGITKPYDYPGFDIKGVGCTSTGCIPNDGLYGDQSLWWVFNDMGNIHGATGGTPIGLEIRAQAFGFSTNDEVNNMTFYNYRIYNRSTFQLNKTYFGVWCDADLGCYTDDYVGCNVEKGFGYTYNGDNNDEVACTSPGYGLNPPAIGIDFFRGPIADAGDGKDNNRNCTVDEGCEQILMSRFHYYNNNATVTGEPAAGVPQDWYNYLSGKWKDGTPVTYGGNGYGGTTPCSFMFPGNPSTDKHDFGIGGTCSTTPILPPWDEVTAGNVPDDRRMLESAGPFTLMPGALNVITTGVVWARATSGGAAASVELLKFADTKAQALFDNCFKITNGPDAPELTIQELDKKLMIYLYNPFGSNNYAENYPYVPGQIEKDPYITAGSDTAWIFEGYKLYQLKDATVSAGDLHSNNGNWDPNKVRPVGVYDINNGVTQIVNYYIGQDPALNYWQPHGMVDEGATDGGLIHSIPITTDLFATGNPTLINHKTYYYMAVAYGYNKGELTTDPSNPPGYNLPYVEGRRNVKLYSAIPHIPVSGSGDTDMHTEYGDTLPVKITRIEGNGNGGNVLDFTTATVDSILASGVYSYTNPNNALYEKPEYESGKGPLSDFEVIDPLNVNLPAGTTFTLWFIPDSTSASTTVNIANSKWKLKNNTTGVTISSEHVIKTGIKYLFTNWGLSLTIEQIANCGSVDSKNNGFLNASMSSNSWLTGFADGDTADYTNWIRSGAATGTGFSGDYVGYDDGSDYEKVIGGTWAPYRLCATSQTTPLSSAKYYGGPAWKSNWMTQTKMYDLASVNVVFTSDKTKWTRCVVLEICDDVAFAEGGQRKLDKRKARSVDKNGNTNPSNVVSTNPSDANYIDTVGMGWFPGYAVNLETGERLNVCFGENSALTQSVGAISYDTLGLGGTFQAADIVTGMTSGATGVIVTDNDTTMRIKNITGTFSIGETITGSGGDTAVVSTYTTFEQNGRDMIWNPTSVKYAANPWDASGTGPVLGGMHYIYVFGHNREKSSGAVYDINIPRYDAGFKMDSMLSINNGQPTDTPKKKVFKDAMWVNIPILATGHSILESDVTVRLHVAKPYKKGYSPAYSLGVPATADTVYGDTYEEVIGYNTLSGTFIKETVTGGNPLAKGVIDTVNSSTMWIKSTSRTFSVGDTITGATSGAKAVISTYTAAAQNNNYPMYTFSMGVLEAPHLLDHTDALDPVTALDYIKVVPNPYYAYSLYEKNSLDNRVKITNLPAKCTVSIYNLSGTLIRTFKKAAEVTNHEPYGYDSNGNPEPTHDGSLDWDLKNTAGIPIASGVYIIHVEVPDVGEKIVKWFGIMRPIDLDSF